jgi:hypothetical protein
MEVIERHMSDVTTIYRMLAAEPRRDVLFALCETPTVQVSEVLKPRDDGRPEQIRPSGGRQESALVDPLELQLYHTHLPKLADVGLVEWERDAGIVSRGPEFSEVRPFVERIRESERELLE